MTILLQNNVIVACFVIALMILQVAAPIRSQSIDERVIIYEVFPESDKCALVYGEPSFSFGGPAFFVRDCGDSWTRIYGFKLPHIKKMQFVSDQVVWGIVGGDIVQFEIDDRGFDAKPITTDEMLEDIFFIDKKTGVACGENGTIMRTTDGGDHWSRIESGTRTDLKSIKFADNKFGWVEIVDNSNGEDFDGYLTTRNGGMTWRKSKLPDGKSAISMSFTSQSHGCAVTSRSEIACTSDGQSWRPFRLEDENRSEITMLTSKRGLAIGDSILITEDGGKNWRKTSPLDEPPRHMVFQNSTTGWAWGWHSVYRTTDGGQTWVKVSDKWMDALTKLK